MPDERILFLPERDVARALEGTDVIAAVADALAAHGRRETTLPAESCLDWTNADEPLRSLGMPALLDGCPGIKIINANPANPDRGLPRASGLILLFDPASGRPSCILEAARISCLRTAAVTAIATDLLGAHPIERIALIGAGALAQCHLELLPSRLPQLREIRLYDLDERRAATLAAESADARVIVCDDPAGAIRGAQLVVPLTTTTSGYIAYDWLAPGTLLVNISLDDPLPEVILGVDKLYVDDWTLVAHDDRRLLGRMLRSGQIHAPDTTGKEGRPVDGELGELVAGIRKGRSRADEIIVVNPLGLAIEDLAVAQQIHQHARNHGLGTRLER
jgi:ornithine cyclodeaminase/alanine dehydrogenase-like protein (mu-crystallin family)